MQEMNISRITFCPNLLDSQSEYWSYDEGHGSPVAEYGKVRV